MQLCDRDFCQIKNLVTSRTPYGKILNEKVCFSYKVRTNFNSLVDIIVLLIGLANIFKSQSGLFLQIYQDPCRMNLGVVRQGFT